MSEFITTPPPYNAITPPPYNIIEPPIKKKQRFSIEMFIVIMLGITAINTAWASWVGAVYTGSQKENYAISNNLSTRGNADFTDAAQRLWIDMLFYQNIFSIMSDLETAYLKGDEEVFRMLSRRIDEQMNSNISSELRDAIDWAHAEYFRTGEYVSPFWEDGSLSPRFVERRFEDAIEILELSEESLVMGRQDGTHSDEFGLATVIYAMVLFLLGIANSFKTGSYKVIVVVIACIAFAFASLYMLAIPLPDGLFG